MRPTVLLVRFCVSGEHRAEIADFVIWASIWQMQNPDKITDVLHANIKNVVPATVARNRAVKVAQQKRADILLMLDDDMIPDPKFFATAVEFLGKHRGPAVIGCPYNCAPPSEDCLVFEWAAFESQAASGRWKLERIRREDAARRTGIERVANLGTGAIAYSMDCFDALKPPYFNYTYNEDHTEVTETEDCFLHRILLNKGIPLYCAWDHWAGHVKKKIVTKPQVIEQCWIDERYRAEARADLNRDMLAPRDIEGLNTDMGDVYAEAVDRAADGARFVEIGCWKGASTILWANLIRRSGKRIELNAVDHFRGSLDETYHRDTVKAAGGSIYPEFAANLRRYNVHNAVRVHDMESEAAARLFADASCDCVYIDGEHNYPAVAADIRAWLPRVKPGGTLAGHDIDMPGVRRAVEEALGNFVIVGRSWLWQKPAADTAPFVRIQEPLCHTRETAPEPVANGHSS